MASCASATLTSAAVSSLSFASPMSAVRGASTSRFVEIVLADRPSRPCASQSSTAFWTVYLGEERIPSRSSSWRSWSLSLDLCLGPAAHFAANAPSVSAEPQGDRAAPPALAAAVVLAVTAVRGVIEVDRVLAVPAPLTVGHARHASTWLPVCTWLPVWLSCRVLSRSICSELVGMAGFEPAASCSQSRRANQAAPHPVRPTVAYLPQCLHRRSAGDDGVHAAAVRGVCVRAETDLTGRELLLVHLERPAAAAFGGRASGQNALPVCVYSASVALQAGKTVTRVVLPDVGSGVTSRHPCISSRSPSDDAPGQRSRYATRDWPGRRVGASPLLAGPARA
jgi:hypothetical protein